MHPFHLPRYLEVFCPQHGRKLHICQAHSRLTSAATSLAEQALICKQQSIGPQAAKQCWPKCNVSWKKGSSPKRQFSCLHAHILAVRLAFISRLKIYAACLPQALHSKRTVKRGQAQLHATTTLGLGRKVKHQSVNCRIAPLGGWHDALHEDVG